MSDAGGTGDPTETLDIDWAHSPQGSRQHYKTRFNLEARGAKEGKEDGRETPGAAIWKQKSNKLDAHGDR